MRSGLVVGILLASAAVVPAADTTSWTAIGLVRSPGEFTIDGSRARDNSTVFHGSVVSTTHAASHVILNDGTRVDFGLDSRGRIYRDRIAIEHGLANIRSSNRYSVIAGKIRIDSPQRTLVRIENSRTVSVTALSGVAEVRNGGGVLIAMVPAGRTLEFSEGDDEERVSGCLQKMAGHYILRDQTTNVLVELAGPNLERHVGETIDVAGSIDPATKGASGASHVIRPSSVARSSQQICRSSLPIPAGMALPALPTGAKIAIVGGIAAAAVGAVVAAAVTSGEPESTSASTASR